MSWKETQFSPSICIVYIAELTIKLTLKKKGTVNAKCSLLKTSHTATTMHNITSFQMRSLFSQTALLDSSLEAEAAQGLLVDLRSPGSRGVQTFDIHQVLNKHHFGN